MKNKLEGNKNFFDWKVKLKRKITLTKEKKIKRIRTKSNNIIHQKLGLNDEIENQ
jgi:hypothetical protein